jgi:hypothetical protein
MNNTKRPRITWQEVARKRFERACKDASKCRHEKYIISCYSCPMESICEIQKRINHYKELI